MRLTTISGASHHSTEQLSPSLSSLGGSGQGWNPAARHPDCAERVEPGESLPPSALSLAPVWMPSKVTPLSDREPSLITRCCLDFLCPNFQISHKAPGHMLTGRENSSSSWVLLVAPEARMPSFLLTTSLWLSKKAFTLWDRTEVL